MLLELSITLLEWCSISWQHLQSSSWS